MRTGAASLPQPERAERQVEVVVDHQEIRRSDAVADQQALDSPPADVHVGLRLGQDDLQVVQPTAAHQAVGPLLVEADGVAIGKSVQHHEARVMATPGILRAGIPEADDQFHVQRNTQRGWSSRPAPERSTQTFYQPSEEWGEKRGTNKRSCRGRRRRPSSAGS